MYAFESMIDIARPAIKKWPTPAHRKVAVAIAICNPRVRTAGSLIDIAKAVCAIPKSEIKKVTLADCAQKYAVPFVSLS